MSENTEVTVNENNAEATEAPAEEAKVKSETDLRRDAYSAATVSLRKKFRKEFDEFLDAEYAKHGLTRRQKLTDEEKALNKMKKFAEAAGIKLTDEQIAALRKGE